MDYEDLTLDQRDVVESEDSVVLALGGPGTGKTTTALWAARRELLSPESRPHERALFVTFSRTATQQLVERAGEAVGDVEDRIDIHTFHGLAHRLLSAFGYLHGLTREELDVQSASEVRIRRITGQESARLTYDDLIPSALDLLDIPLVQQVMSRRWRILLCDEYQDTSDKQWALINRIPADRRVFLADPDQMIYDFLEDKGVGPQRLADANEIAEHVVELPMISHRDPSLVIPQAAKDLLLNRTGSPHVARALELSRIEITGRPQSSIAEGLLAVVRDRWAQGDRTFGIYTQKKEQVLGLSDSFIERHIDHAVMGLDEGHAEALNLMVATTQFGLGESEWGDVLVTMAYFLDSVTKQSQVPALARAMATSQPLPDPIAESLRSLKHDLEGHSDLEQLAVTASECWSRIPIIGGTLHWARMQPRFVSTFRRALQSGERTARELAEALVSVRNEMLLNQAPASNVPIRLMNFHQTKGREFDSSILLFNEDDTWAWYPDQVRQGDRRVLYVAVTRARNYVRVLLPASRHALGDIFRSFE